MLASFSGASPEARTRLLLGAAGLQSAGRPPGHTMHIMEEGGGVEPLSLAGTLWFSGPVAGPSQQHLPNLAETPRFERGQPEGFGRLATCWFNRSPTLPYLVPMTGLEPARYSQTGLSRSCLPVPPHRQILVPQEGLEPPRRRRLFLRQVCLPFHHWGTSLQTWRARGESNSRRWLCRPPHDHSATRSWYP